MTWRNRQSWHENRPLRVRGSRDRAGVRAPWVPQPRVQAAERGVSASSSVAGPQMVGVLLGVQELCAVYNFVSRFFPDRSFRKWMWGITCPVCPRREERGSRTLRKDCSLSSKGPTRGRVHVTYTAGPCAARGEGRGPLAGLQIHV